MIAKNKILYITIMIFTAAFVWGTFFTYGFDFFWEDFVLFHLDKEEYPIQTDFISRFTSGAKVLGKFIKDSFASHRLFQVSFGSNERDRPYLFHTTEFLSIIFRDKAILYRILKVILFSINVCIVFILINRKSLKLALAGAFLYITSSEMWVSLAYNTDVGMYAQLAMLVSILLFLYLLLRKRPVEKKRLWLYYFGIFLAANYAVLTRGDGRYLAVLFILTFIFFRRSELKFHAPMLSLLLVLQIPVLGYIKKFFTGSPASPINIASHNDRSAFESFKIILSNLQYPKNALGNALLVLLCIIILIHLLSIIFKKSGRFFDRGVESTGDLKVQTFLFMLWFIFSFVMIAVSRSFSYSGPYDWIVSEGTFYITPFIIFLCYYAYMISVRLRKQFQQVFIAFCLILVAVQLGLNLSRINRFRGGWGNYFCAWKNVEKYIDRISNNAMVYTATEMCYKPFVFRHSNNKVVNNYPGSHNLAFIEKIFEEKGYSDIFLARRFGVVAEGNSEKVILKDRINIDGDTGDLYDRVKLMIGIHSRPVIEVDHFKYKTDGNK